MCEKYFTLSTAAVAVTGPARRIGRRGSGLSDPNRVNWSSTVHWPASWRRNSDNSGRQSRLRAGENAKIKFPVHPHMLRHGCGYKLANDGQDTRAIQHYMGHKNIQHTVRYTELASDRFNGFFKD